MLIGRAFGDGLDDPLERELIAAGRGLSFAAVRAVLDLGAPRGFVAALTGAGEIGRARVRLLRGRNGQGLFEFDPAGEPRLILAVREGGVLIDLVALSSAQRDAWALRRGEDAVLGADALIAAQVRSFAPRPGGAPRDERVLLRVHGTPLDWLIGGGDGVCVLDWTASAIAALRGLGPGVSLLADDAGAAERLRGVLAWGALPKVAVAGTVAARKIAA